MDTITADNRTAVLSYVRLRNITTLLRCVEAVAVAVLILWSSAHVPSLIRSSAQLLRRLVPVLVGPRFLFLIGNSIVIALLLKSRNLAADGDDVSAIGEGISAFALPPTSPAPQKEEVVFEDKRVLLCVESSSSSSAGAAPAPARSTCRRSKSAKIGERQPRAAPELRRSETDVGKANEDAEEFRRTIEAFIEKQWKFQRQESMAMTVVCSDAVETDEKQLKDEIII